MRGGHHVSQTCMVFQPVCGASEFHRGLSRAAAGDELGCAHHYRQAWGTERGFRQLECLFSVFAALGLELGEWQLELVWSPIHSLLSQVDHFESYVNFSQTST